MASSWKNSHFGTQKMLLGRNKHPPGSERKERNECIKRGTKKSGAKKKSEGEREGNEEVEDREVESAYGKAR